MQILNQYREKIDYKRIIEFIGIISIFSTYFSPFINPINLTYD